MESFIYIYYLFLLFVRVKAYTYIHSSHQHITMPVQAPQWTEFLLCPICTQTFEETVRRPISLGCGHTVCKMCLNKLHRKACPFDQTAISTDIEQLPVNTALLQLVGGQVKFVLVYFLFFCWPQIYKIYIAKLCCRIIGSVFLSSETVLGYYLYLTIWCFL